MSKTCKPAGRSECIAAYDFVCRCDTVSPVPAELANVKTLRETTVNELMATARKVVDSDYFKGLPAKKRIESGGTKNFAWVKVDAETQLRGILAEVGA